MRRVNDFTGNVVRLTACLLLAAPALAVEKPLPADIADCSDAAYHRLDFRIGEFDVTTASGLAAGRSRVEALLGGCLLVEHWRGALAGAGQAHYYFERRTDRWRLFFVNDEGMTLDLAAPAGRDVLVFEGLNTFGQLSGLHRMTFAPMPQGDVRQFWELSVDEGHTWQTILDARYARLKPPGAADAAAQD
jgi:hypothetical protein